MDDILLKTLNLIDDIINKSETKDLDFYPSILNMMSSLYINSTIEIYFLEDTDYIFKAGIGKGKIIQEKTCNVQNVEKLIDSKENFITFNNTMIVKLSIKNSIFGFCVLKTRDKLNNDIMTSFNAIINIVSYKIKDYELSQVFKIQLKALQDAISDKQNTYELIKKQHKKLQEIDKTKNLFLANISHDLRTPLNAIIGFSQALDSGIFGKLNDKQSEYIKDIQISGLHLLGMINELLDISKLEAHVMKFNPTELKPNQVIKEVVNILEPLYKNKNIKIEFKDDFDGLIKADYQKLQQILFNLLSNAIKFTNENGKIEVESNFKDKNYILKVKDNGIGIAKKDHSKIFKKFVHLSNVYTKKQNSTGLGLTITKELAKLHNGKITLESELDKGSTFTIEFKDMIL